jgi:hypothetical protein
MKRDVNTAALKSIYESAKGLHKIGLMSDSELQEFEVDCAFSSSVTTHSVSLFAPSTSYTQPVTAYASGRKHQ